MKINDLRLCVYEPSVWYSFIQGRKKMRTFFNIGLCTLKTLFSKLNVSYRIMIESLYIIAQQYR